MPCRAVFRWYIQIYTCIYKKSIAPHNFFWSVRKLTGPPPLVRVRESVRLDNAARRTVPANRALPLCRRVSWSRDRCGAPHVAPGSPASGCAALARFTYVCFFLDGATGPGRAKLEFSRASWSRPVPEEFAASMRFGPAGPSIPRDERRPRTKKRERERSG